MGGNQKKGNVAKADTPLPVPKKESSPVKTKEEKTSAPKAPKVTKDAKPKAEKPVKKVSPPAEKVPDQKAGKPADESGLEKGSKGWAKIQAEELAQQPADTNNWPTLADAKEKKPEKKPETKPEKTNEKSKSSSSDKEKKKKKKKKKTSQKKKKKKKKKK